MKIFEYFTWFGSNEVDGVILAIEKSDVSSMKNADNTLEEKVQQDLLQHASDAVDRRIVMVYEKNFRNKFKKLGNLNQKCPYCAKEYRALNLGEKKCTQCKNTFLVLKRVQDMGTVAIKLEQKEQFEVQWKATSDIRRFKYYLSSEFEYIQKQLQKQGKRNLKESDIMQALLSAYAKNSISAGYYRLYAAFLFHKAELLRSEQDFAEALTLYFYIHFLVTNGVNDKAEFQINLQVNAQVKQRIEEMLDLGDIQMRKVKDLYTYAIHHHNRFNAKQLCVNLDKSYNLLVKEFKEKDEAKEGIKPMRSFVLYSNKAS